MSENVRHQLVAVLSGIVTKLEAALKNDDKIEETMTSVMTNEDNYFTRIPLKRKLADENDDNAIKKPKMNFKATVDII